MKVKELAEIFKVSPAELLKILPNVGVDVSLKEETMIDKDVEKKLAKRYNVPYPFKKAAPKPKPVEAPHVAQKPTPDSKPKPRVTPKPATEIPKKPVETPHVVKKPIVEEIIQPRVDEETLEKYQEFLEDDEYNITRENKGRGR